MGTLLTQTEILFPKAAGAAVYTWRAEMPDGRRVESTEGGAALYATGRFPTFEEARDDAQGWLLELSGALPREVLILRAQPEAYALMRVG
jgi:hypothetical protein